MWGARVWSLLSVSSITEAPGWLSRNSQNLYVTWITCRRTPVEDHASEIGNDDCRWGDGLISPSFSGDLRTEPPRHGETRDPYDRSTGVSRDGDPDECGVLTRT